MKGDHDINTRFTDRETRQRTLATKVAPAVALLMVGERAFAVDFEDQAQIPEPTTLSLLAIGAAGAAVAAGVNKRRKK